MKDILKGGVTELERPSLSCCDSSSITDSNLSRFGERSPPCEQSLVMHHVVGGSRVNDNVQVGGVSKEDLVCDSRVG